MIAVSNEFKNAMKQPVKEIRARLTGDNILIEDDGDLIQFKISADSGLCKTTMRKLEAKIIGSYDLLGKWVHASFGVKLAGGTFEYLDYGSFLITEITQVKDSETTTIVGYDKMINTMKSYETMDIEYPVSLLDYTKLLCRECELEVGNYNVPKEYTQVEYIASNTTQYIDIDYKPIINEKIECNIEFTNLFNQSIYGSATGSQKSVFGISSSYKWEYQDNIGWVSSNVVAMANTKYKVEFYNGANSQYLKVNDETVASGTHTFSGTTRGINAYVFARNGGSSVSSRCQMRLYSMKIYNNDVLVKDLVPCIRNSDSEVGLYDKVTRTFYTNAGTGTFTYGDVVNRLPILNDWEINGELWENINGITYRDIIQQIAQATGSTAIISNDDKIYFRPITDTGEELTYDNMFKWKLEPKYGEINSVVLSRSPMVGEDVIKQDESSIEDNGLTEWKIENNEIIDKDRESAIDFIYDAMVGINFYPFEITTEGLGWYEIADSFNIINDLNQSFNGTLFNFAVTIDGGIKETLKTKAENKTQTQYQYATKIDKRLKNTEIVVNKQEQYIQDLVYDMYEEDGIVHENFTEIHQDINNIINSVQKSGGDNILKNSVMFALDESTGTPTNWTVTGSGTLSISSSAEAMANGGISGNVFTLLNKTVSQRVNVKANNSGMTEEEKTYYSFSTKIKKSATGTCYVRIYNSLEEYRIDLTSGESAFWNEYEIKELLPMDNYYIIEFYGSADSGATFTDNMFALGKYKTQWTQASGEIMNTQVNINVDGVMVKSSVYSGDYTVMSPLEFAGYSNINGTITKVFTINKDTTEVEKLKVKKGITMTPIKIVPVTEGNLIGWGFVASS